MLTPRPRPRPSKFSVAVVGSELLQPIASRNWEAKFVRFKCISVFRMMCNSLTESDVSLAQDMHRLHRLYNRKDHPDLIKDRLDRHIQDNLARGFYPCPHQDFPQQRPPRHCRLQQLGCRRHRRLLPSDNEGCEKDLVGNWSNGQC